MATSSAEPSSVGGASAVYLSATACKHIHDPAPSWIRWRISVANAITENRARVANFPAKAIVTPIRRQGRRGPAEQRFVHWPVKYEEVGQHNSVAHHGYEIGMPARMISPC